MNCLYLLYLLLHFLNFSKQCMFLPTLEFDQLFSQYNRNDALIGWLVNHIMRVSTQNTPN